MNSHTSISQFNKWIPENYLKDYYSSVEPDEKETIAFLVNTFKKIKNNPILLEFGCGPTLHHIFPATPYVSEIHMADYLSGNLGEIKKWIQHEHGAHNWKKFIDFTLRMETGARPSKYEIEKREKTTKEKIKGLFQVDANKIHPMGKVYDKRYDVVLSCYCADSATNNKYKWERYMRHIASLVAPGGTFITAALRNADYYKVGSRYFPSAHVNEEDLRKVLMLDFSPESITIEIRSIPQHESQGYTSILLAHAKKPK